LDELPILHSCTALTAYTLISGSSDTSVGESIPLPFTSFTPWSQPWEDIRDQLMEMSTSGTRNREALTVQPPFALLASSEASECKMTPREPPALLAARPNEKNERMDAQTGALLEEAPSTPAPAARGARNEHNRNTAQEWRGWGTSLELLPATAAGQSRDEAPPGLLLPNQVM